MQLLLTGSGCPFLGMRGALSRSRQQLPIKYSLNRLIARLTLIGNISKDTALCGIYFMPGPIDFMFHVPRQPAFVLCPRLAASGFGTGSGFSSNMPIHAVRP